MKNRNGYRSDYMNNTETINIYGETIQIKEYNGQRVLTFKDIDALHNKINGTTGYRFRKNKEHFVEGEDYILCSSSDAKSDYSIIAPRGLTLLTETGYLFLVKSLTDDLSRDVQRQLVNTYFNVKVSVAQTDIKHHDNNDTNPDFSWVCPRISNYCRKPKRSWFTKNYHRMMYICWVQDISLGTLYHRILVYIGRQYNLEEATKQYIVEVGHEPEYPMTVVQYFDQLADCATTFLNKLEVIVRCEKRKLHYYGADENCVNVDEFF